MTRHRGHRSGEQHDFEFFATCPEGFEGALADELRSLRLARVRPLKGRVSFAGSALDGERACLWSRLASRVLAVLGRFEAVGADELYEGAYAIPWERVLAPGASIAVAARGTTDELRNSHFSALKVKDAVCDRLVDERGSRPAVDVDEPDARIAVSIRGRRVTVHLDLSGEALFRRLPAIAAQAGAPAHVLRPDYAALALAQAGWQRICAAPRPDDGSGDAALPLLIDPCCAGGGIVLEAASILAGQAPGCGRERWGFTGWAAHDEEAWRGLVDGTRARGPIEPRAKIVATDVSGAAVSFARRVLKAAGLGGRVLFTQPETEKILRKASLSPCADAPARGAIVLDTTGAPLTKMSRVLGLATDLRAGIGLGLVALTRDDLLCRDNGEPDRTLRVMPDNEEARILCFAPPAETAATGGEDTAGAPEAAPREPAVTLDLGQGEPIPLLAPGSSQFANRLRKNARLRRKWARREGITCYRVYDADLPDYAAAIDLYEGAGATPGRWLVIAEYAAPKSVNGSLAQARMLDILAIAPSVLEVDPGHVFARTRTRSRGGSQYGKSATGGAGAQETPLIEEGGLTFEVNFGSYLDTGIFLDHRVTRARLREHIRETGARRFLNLFAYTGTATCYAADAGVEETVTVDLSNTYLDWAERNMAANGFTGPAHHYVRADVMSWISEMRRTRNRWDLIFCDPPTFSNSTKMGRRTWDVQRDHVELLIGLSRLLTRGGEAVFSCNLRTFRPDTEALARAGVALIDVTAETIPEDFARTPRIHRCYLLRRCAAEEALGRIGLDA